MNATKGLNELRKNLDRAKAQIVNDYNTTFSNLSADIDRFVSSAGTSYVPLADFKADKNNPRRTHSPRGFMYGSEKVENFVNKDTLVLPHIYEFMRWPATAIEASSPNAFLLFNYALRAISSFVIGDSNVYLLDSNISGDFNLLSSISTDVDDTDTEKNNFHYITTDADKETMLSNLSEIMDRNIRNYVSRYPDLYTYNADNQLMFESYNFVFIRDIANVLSDRGQIDRLTRLVSQNNASKAGIYLFYTYDKKVLANAANSYYAESAKSLQRLLDVSHILQPPSPLYAGSAFSLEPKAAMREVDEVIDFVHVAKPPKTIMSFKDDINAMLGSGTLWQEQKDEKKGHLFVPIGFTSAIKKKILDISFKGTSPHIYVGGKTGSGKSILLHNLIVNSALRYSPELLRFYLVDMKGGVSFVGYKKLPHLAALSASSSRHYAESLLQLFCQQVERNYATFKRNNVTSLAEYNERAKSTGLPLIPYKMAIIDEFQELFTVNDTIARNAQRAIEYIHRIGRSAGVILALCTQEPPSNIDRSQVGIKMALICRPNASIALIGNSGASRLKGIGRAIVNTSEEGEEKYNQEFQTPFIDEERELPDYSARMNDIWLAQHGGSDPLVHMIYDDNELRVPLSSNDQLFAPQDNTYGMVGNIWIGAPAFYRKEHVKFAFHRDSQSNVAMVGADRPSALRIVGMTILQMMEAYRDTVGCKVYVSDLQRQTEPTFGKLSFLAEGSSTVVHGVSANVKETLGEVYALLESRRQNPAQSIHEPEVLYAVLDLKPDSNFAASRGGGINFGGPTQKSCLEMLSELISMGPDFGIHVMAYSYNYQNMAQLLNNFGDSLLGKMEVKIGLRGGNSNKMFNFGNREVVERNGEGFIRMPQDMGLYYVEGDDYGDPFRIYDEADDEILKGSAWEKLFKLLPNIQY